jgi:hypothetical protein
MESRGVNKVVGNMRLMLTWKAGVCTIMVLAEG